MQASLTMVSVYAETDATTWHLLHAVSHHRCQHVAIKQLRFELSRQTCYKVWGAHRLL